jgi:hypothetical protein
MGLFKKKSDPLSERAHDLNKEIAKLEEEIQRLSHAEPSPIAPPTAAPQSPAPLKTPAPRKISPAKPPDAATPRIRSTSRPGGTTILKKPPASTDTPGAKEGSPQEAGLVHGGHNPVRATAAPPEEPASDMGIRRDSLSSTWQRLKNHFRGPITSNPKLVNYLAAGSIQGLRPLRYERRVARNRFIVLVAILVLILWGLLALLIHR